PSVGGGLLHDAHLLLRSMASTSRASTRRVAAARAVDHDRASVRRILDAALALWGSRGYNGASLKEIAARARVAKSLLHYHFESKGHLLFELQQHLVRTMSERIFSLPAPSGASPEEAADRALDRVWETLVELSR